MFCASCGKEFQADMNFCPYCGAPAVKNEQQSQNYNYGYNYNQQFNNGQYYAPNGFNMPDPTDVPSAGFNALAFFFPVVGLILYLIWKDEKPKRAKSIGKSALISVIIGVVLYVLSMIAFFVLFAATGYTAFSYMV